MDRSTIQSSGFRKASIYQRRELLTQDSTHNLNTQSLESITPNSDLLDLADIMVENAIGMFPSPLGIAQGFFIDGREYAIPLAVEEPSVIAAASYAAGLVSKHGGFTTQAGEPLMTGQVYTQVPLEQAAQAKTNLEQQEQGIVSVIKPNIAGMERRGGGYRGMDVEYLESLQVLRLHFHLDVRDAMGANIINTCAEALRPLVEQVTGGKVILAILSNQAIGRVTKARFSIPYSALRRGSWAGKALAERIVLAGEIAHRDPARAVTHNKGVMNGITSLALATANDTRGIEAAVHSWAARSGSYGSITRYGIDQDQLWGEFEAPLPFAVVGGGVSFHPAAQVALQILGNPSAIQLSRIAAALGLAQNLAALMALTGEGIQHGHMRLHAGRLAYKAGARGEEISTIQTQMSSQGVYNIEKAQELLEAIRKGKP
jgi:hydroxymethylglutaryl-CoA reductase